MMNKTENTLYILQNLSSTESKDLDYAEIDVYYEDKQGNEGATQYDMPAIADDAISTINELQSKIAEIEAEVSAWSDLWDEAMNAVHRCARKEAWHDEHPLLRFHHTKALKEQG